MAQTKPQNNTLTDTVGSFVDIVTIPAAIGAAAYTFFAKTGDELYDTLKDLKKLPEILEDKRVYYETAHFGENTPKMLRKYHKDWSARYSAHLKESGFHNIFDRFGGLHGNQQLEVIVHSVTAGALVVGFWALLDQLRHNSQQKDSNSL